MNKYIFFYFIEATANAVKKSAPNHARYWENKLIIGGPFVDFSGGFVTFEANSLDEATKIANADPFVKDGILSEKILKEWMKK